MPTTTQQSILSRFYTYKTTQKNTTFPQTTVQSAENSNCRPKKLTNGLFNI